MQSPRLLFEAHGLRCTKQREHIFSVLSASNAHPTADEIYHLVRDCCCGLSLATVYNALEAFADSGLCRKIPNAHGASRYDACLHDHVHMILPDGQVVDVPEDLSDSIVNQIPNGAMQDIEDRLGVRIKGMVIQLITEPASEPEPD